MKKIALSLSLLLLGGSVAFAADDPAMFGGTPSRNMVSDATDLPAKWNPDTGENIKWRAKLGSQSYGGPILHGGKIFVGTNNESPRNEKITGDKGVVMVFDAATGEFLWQAIHDKLPDGRVHDWPQQGVCSGPYVEGDRLWYVSNQAHVVCADVEGFRDGKNAGPIKDEKDTGDEAADYIWSYDMIGELDVFPHNLAVCSPFAIGDRLFIVTGNGVDEGHINIPVPQAPSFIALDKNTGELLWESALPGDEILHGSWSNPAYGTAGGREQVVMPGGDGWMYSLDPATGELIWKFDCNPKDSVWELGGTGSRNNIVSTPVFANGKVFIAVGQDPEHGEGEGHLFAIDASGEGDITEKGAVWHRGGEEFNRTISTVAVKDGLVYAADMSGFLYCLDEKDGKHYWTYDAYAAVWGSPYVADGKIYLGDEDGDIAVLKEGKKLEVLAEINMGSSVYTTPIAEDGVLYVASRKELFAIAEGAGAKPKPQKKDAKGAAKK